MLQSIREHTQGWIAGVIISIIIVSFALWGIHSYFVSNPNNEIVAEVNGTNITNYELGKAYERMRRQIQAQYGANAITANNEAALKNQALKALIDIEALSQTAEAQGFFVSDQQIENYLQTQPEFQVNGQFSIDRLQQVLTASQLSNSEFINLIKKSLLIEQPKVGIIFTSFALPEQTEIAVKLVNQDRNIVYVKIPASLFTNNTIPHSDIVAYYDAHKNEFMTPEQVSIEYVELNQADVAKSIKPEEEDLKRFYSENSSSYLSLPMWKLNGILIPLSEQATNKQIAEAKTKAENIHQAIVSGESFEKATNKYQKLKLESGYLTQKQIPFEYQSEVSQIEKSGGITQPIKTNKGFVIIRVTDYKPSQPENYETVKAKVKEAYLQQKTEEKFADLKERLADLTYENPTSLNQAAKELHLPIKKTEYFTKDKPGTGITEYAKIRNAAFMDEVLSVRNNSDVIPVNNTTVIVLRVNNHIQTSLLPLNAVVEQINLKLKKQSADKESEKLAAVMAGKLNQGEDPHTFAKQYKLNWQETGFIGRYSTKVDNAILDAAFRLPNVGPANQKIYYAATRLPDGFAVIGLKAVREGHIIDNKQATVFAEQAQSSEGLLEYELYKQSQVNNASVKIRN